MRYMTAPRNIAQMLGMLPGETVKVRPVQGDTKRPEEHVYEVIGLDGATIGRVRSLRGWKLARRSTVQPRPTSS